ncbi:hypothetical protein [Microbacterium natoriense]|uniref:hypothetical protein n=1 Tax=Microbacterium natoriense TaxID=284570 RepID=UPI0027D8CB6C|nr:hypothetical protein [Microbacterium natoriense]
MATLAAGVIALSGCTAGSTGSAATQYQNSESAYDQLVIVGDQVIYLTTSADHVVDMLKLTDAGDIDPEGEYVEDVGQLNEARDTVIWSDGDDDPIEITDDMIRLTDPNAGSDSAVYIRYDDERASTERERVIAEKS